MSLPANPVPAELYHFVRGTPGSIWLPWYIWGGGVFATKYDYDTTKFHGYLGTISVPLQGKSVTIHSLRLEGAVEGKIGTTEGAMVRAILWKREQNFSAPIATIVVDRRTMSIGNPYVDIEQSAGGFKASAAEHELSIELLGIGQGIATIHGLVIKFSI